MRRSNIKLIALIASLSPTLLMAKGGNSDSVINWVFDNIIILTAIFVIFVAVIVLWRTLMTMLRYKEEQILVEQGVDVSDRHQVSSESWLDRRFKGLWGLKPIEEEKELLLNHDYDGIRELDNKLPPWWLYLFYATIAWALVYFYIYQISGIGKTQQEVYYEEMKIADEKKADFLYKQANLVNENNVTAITDADALAEAQKVFMGNCLACHGAQGQGGIGPNLTDEYWLHGGSVKDVFKTIKYGVPEKGMIAWSDQLTPSTMQKVASYIMTLQGTNPPNAKERQGEKYVAEAK